MSPLEGNVPNIWNFHCWHHIFMEYLFSISCQRLLLVVTCIYKQEPSGHGNIYAIFLQHYRATLPKHYFLVTIQTENDVTNKSTRLF